MTVPVGLGLARVTVATPKRRIDVALPDNAPVGELLPHLLRHAGEELADAGEAHGGWVLRRATGTRLDASRSLSVQGVRDGEVLQLAPGRLDWPELAYDDVVEVIASGARRAGRSWGKPATRACTLAVTAALLGAGLVEVLLSGPPWAAPGGVALGVAALLMLAGLLLSRAFADATAGGVVGGTALPYAFLGGALLVAPRGAGLLRLGAPSLLLGSITLLLLAIIGYAAVAAVHRLYMAGIAAGLSGLLAALLSMSGMSGPGAAAVTLTVVIGLLPGYPLLAGWLGRLPVPELPDRPEAILEDRPVPARTGVFASVARSTELLSGMLLSAAIVATATGIVLIASGGAWSRLLALAAAIALLLRGRLFPTPAQRVPLLVAGAAALLMPVFAAALRTDKPGTRLLLLLAIVAAAAVVLIAGLLYSGKTPSPYVGRIADIVDVLAIMALVPFACGVAGVYQAIQGLFASFGS